MRKMLSATLLFALLFLATSTIGAQPRINRLHREDPVYRQHQDLLSEFHEAYTRGYSLTPLVILSYTPVEGDTLFSVAARLMLPYGSLATLNRLHRPEISGAPILVPTQPGIFVYPEAESELEQSVARRLQSDERGVLLRLPREGQMGVVFYPGADFSAAERSIFLRVQFMDPLPTGVISSRYGYRMHPMGGRRVFHQGLDLAASFGGPVVSAAAGVVSVIHRDPLLGLSVHVDHMNGYSSVYAHLQEALVGVDDEVKAGQPIGAVGSTGYSTGPHLHFEIRLDGITQNPERYIR